MAEHVYEYGGRRLRLISGRGQVLSAVKAQFEKEPPFPQQVQQVVCAGALIDPTPANVVRGAGTPTIVRPAQVAEWVTHDELLAELSSGHV